MQREKARKSTLTDINTENNFLNDGTQEYSKRRNKPMLQFFSQWAGRNEFLGAQAQMAAILLIAYIGDNWKESYPRNDNHNPQMFWIMNACLLVVALASWRHKPNPRGVVLLSRAQTEEWKGWMQWAFIMYHYYRVFYVYNEIRVFVSSYVWMTGFGNFLYFDKKKDYSLQRVVSMCIRINYFPLLLSYFMGTPLDLYYVVPLHTVGFFMTMITCWIAHQLEIQKGMKYWPSRITAIGISLIFHILFYETSMVNSLKYFSDEIHFRFQADKYSAWQGLIGGLLFGKLNEYLNWAYGSAHEQVGAKWLQRVVGISLILTWWGFFGYIEDKFQYNPLHPYIFAIPLVGWLMIRNSSRYLTESYSMILEFLGRNTLETYVLQFHLFMCQGVQHIPIVIPGSGSGGLMWLKVANMLFCGAIFLLTSVWARRCTVTTQTTVVELLALFQNQCFSKPNKVENVPDEESAQFLEVEVNEHGEKTGSIEMNCSVEK
mmetsp:Transcript_65768/g.77307  ORF Transcript_65768/g.77307 Transcript_65768/m.77307 type:complete len:488 (-) Transcript_65768:201-1664(-)